MKPPLCLNMIVKNEAARVERCLLSVLPYVKSVAILDTGSTDDTQRIIKQVCHEHGVPYETAYHHFVDFSDARNRAWRLAQSFNNSDFGVPCQFALLMDADMELVVDDPKAFDNLDANALSYDMMQKGGTVSYGNRRLLNLKWGADPYVGVTHEYIDVPAAGMITGARFIDHADGANRANKYERDVRLLEAAVENDPANARHWFYLGNTYRDMGNAALAVLAYKHRIELGGWDEEIHNAKMNRAQALLDLKDTAGFVAGMVDAYNYRPSRAEPLYDLAKYHREKGDNAAALLFAKAGLNIKRPGDLLFVNDFVYSHGLRYECSIAGYYDPAERKSAFENTNALALDPTCPEEYRWSARSNLFWHLQPLRNYCPSFIGTKLDVPMPDGYTAINPSIEVCNDQIKINIRAVNYRINEHGQYMIGELGCQDAPIDTRNFLCTYSQDLTLIHQREIRWDRPPPAWGGVTGLEDVRLWRYCGELRFSATVREQNAAGVCEMVQGRLAYGLDDNYIEVTGWTKISDGATHEKNWMPMPATFASGPRFAYRLDRIITPVPTPSGPPCWTGVVSAVDVHVGDLSGSSQLIPFKHGYLGVVHEAGVDPTNGKRTYWHRFVWLDMDDRLRRISLPFVFYDRQIEFCAGLAYHPNHKDLMISFGVRDEEAHVATVNIEEVSALLWKFHEN